MTYSSIVDLASRFGSVELAQLALLPDQRFIGEAQAAADLPTTYVDAIENDIAWAWVDGAFYRFDGDAWGALTVGKLDHAIADADAEIDGYLSGLYGLPLLNPPAALTRVCSDIARYYLYDDAAPEQVKTRYENAIAYLRDVGMGKIHLYPETPESGSGDVYFESSPSVFSRDERF